MKPVLGVDVSVQLVQPVDKDRHVSYSVQAVKPFHLDDHTVLNVRASYDFKKSPVVQFELKRRF